MGKKHKDTQSPNLGPWLVLLGVIIAALLTFLGVIIKSNSDRVNTQIPIWATQTAEAAATARASLVVPTGAVGIVSPSPTSSPSPRPTPTYLPTQTFVPTPDPSAAIRALIQKEADCVVNKQLDCVSAIFAKDAAVRDAYGASFVGIGEIRQRYSGVSRDLDFRYLRHTQVQVTVSGTRATATACTDQSWIANGVIQNPPIQRENWEFGLTDEGWRVTMFIYNLGPC